MSKCDRCGSVEFVKATSVETVVGPNCGTTRYGDLCGECRFELENSGFKVTIRRPA